MANKFGQNEGMSIRRPQLELRVTRGADIDGPGLSALARRLHEQARDDLGMTALEAFGQPKDRAQHPYGIALASGKCAEPDM